MKITDPKLLALGYTSKCIIRPSTNPNKEYYMCYHGNNLKKYEHILLYEAYIGPIPEGYVVHHKDDNGLNNDLTNLEIMSRSHHRITHGRKLYIDGKYYTLNEAMKEFGWSDKGNLCRSVDNYIANHSYRSSWYGHQVEWR